MGLTFFMLLKRLLDEIHTRMKFILGTKTGMTQIFDAEGVCRAATVLKVSPATVSQVKTTEKDGYAAVQLASGEQKEHRVSKAEKGHFGSAVEQAKEYRPRVGEEARIEGVEKGTTLDATTFEEVARADPI